MKEPKSQLPWSLIEDNTIGLYSEGSCFTVLDEGTYIQDAEYMVQVVNAFPRAIELLKVSLNLIGEIHATNKENFDKLIKFNEINEFLTKLKENE